MRLLLCEDEKMLSIAKTIVALHKGKIQAYSADGRSIEFVAIL